MAKQISQETFDDVVRENIEEFEMSPEEAVEEASSQFVSQGVNLANIVKDLSLHSGGGEGGTSIHPVIAAINSLSALLKQQPLDNNKVRESVEEICAECEKDLAHRCLAAKNDAYPVLMGACEQLAGDTDAQRCSIVALCALCNGQPDVLEDKGRHTILSVLRESRSRGDAAMVKCVVTLVRLTCVMAEANRQSYITDGIIPLLMETMETCKQHSAVVKETCHTLRILTLDDDVRVAFGKSHETAKMIVMEAGALQKLLEVSQMYIGERAVLGEVFGTLASLAVRDEFCKEIMELGGLKMMLNTLSRNMEYGALCRQVMVVMKAIAGNDQVKVEIINTAGVDLLLGAINKHIKNAAVCEMGCAAIATIVLRQPAACEKVMAAGAAETLVKVLQLHTSAAVQKQASMAVRNLVARTRQHCQAFLELGVEPLLQQALATHQSLQDETKSALRDLGCQVVLQERWKGEGKGIQY